MMVVRLAEGYVGLVEEVAHLHSVVGLGVGLGSELGLKELRPKVEEVKVLGVGMVRAIGLAPNIYPVP